MRRMKVRVGGHLVHTAIGCKDLDFTFRRPYGCWEASFQAIVGDGWRHPAFVDGALYEVLYGGSRPWYGVLNGVDWQTGEMTGMGMMRVLERYRARYWDTDLGLVATWNPRLAIDDVINPNPLSGRTAVPIRRDDSVPDVDLMAREPDAEPMQLLDLLDLATKKGYGVPSIGGDGVLRFLPDPTVRTWSVHPRVVDIGNAGGEDTATRIFVLYQFKTSLCWDQVTSYPVDTIIWWDDQLWRKASSGGSGVKPVDGGGFWNPVGTPDVWSSETDYEDGSFVTSDNFDFGIGDTKGNVWEATVAGTRTVGDPPPGSGWDYCGQLPYDETTEASNGTVEPYREAPEVDARPLGPISTSEADEIAAAALAEALSPSYTSDIEVTPFTVTGQHGTPIIAWGHQAGELGRVNGVADPRLGQPFIEPISAEYQVKGADSEYPTAVIKLVGKEARGYIEVMQAALEARRKREWVG